MKKIILALIMLCIFCFLFIGAANADSDVITACVSSKTGAMTLLTGNACPKGTYPITWNQQAAVHGTVRDDGSILRGTGFSVAHDSIGYYLITFSTPFASTPDCVATQSFSGADWQSTCVAINTNNTTTLYVRCTEAFLISPNQDTWPLIGAGIPYFVLNGYGPYQTTNTGVSQTQLVDLPFTFICVD